MVIRGSSLEGECARKWPEDNDRIADRIAWVQREARPIFYQYRCGCQVKCYKNSLSGGQDADLIEWNSGSVFTSGTSS